MNQYIKQYQKMNIETASKEQILIMLYDGAIQFLNKAKIAINEKNVEEAHNNLMKAQNIIQEFINSMDVSAAPQVANNLISLYEYFIRRLVYANMKQKIEPVDEVLTFLKSLRQTWQKAIALAQQQQKEEQEEYKSIDIKDDENDDDEE